MVFRMLLLALMLGSGALASDGAWPDIALKSFPDQAPVKLRSLAGKPTYLKFWATWCQPCMAQMPHFEEIAKKYADDINVVAVNININEREGHLNRVVKKFGLTMPVWLDNEGELAMTLGLEGTPYSVLLDPNGRILYTTHEADEALDKQLAILASGNLDSLKVSDLPDAGKRMQLLQPWMKGRHLAFFTATWCDWYLEESRPEMSQRCKASQAQLAKLHQALPNASWKGVVNHLWTDDKAVNEFSERFDTPIPFQIDTHGVLFHHFNIRELPTLLLIEDGKVVKRFTDLTSVDSVIEQLSAE